MNLRSISNYLLIMTAVAGAAGGCAVRDRKTPEETRVATADSVPGAAEAIKRDYQRLSGTWQLTRAVVNGVAVPEGQLKRTILITDGNTFRFPEAAGVATHPAGTFSINPSVVPHQVDSTAIGGANAGQLTLGIFEIIDDTHKRACWGPPGGPRPTAFESTPGSKRILQYWEKIGPVPSAERSQMLTFKHARLKRRPGLYNLRCEARRVLTPLAAMSQRKGPR